MAKFRVRFPQGERRVARSRASSLVLLAAVALVGALVGWAILRSRSRPSAADRSSPDASVQPDADAVREHNAEVLFARAKIAASMHSWRSARENLARLKKDYSKTSFFKINQAAIAELEKTIERPLAKAVTKLDELYTLDLAILSGKHRPIATLKGHKGPVRDVAISPDGRWMASAGEDGKIRLWDARTGKCVGPVGSDEPVTAVVFCPDGQHLISAANDRLVQWELRVRGALEVAKIVDAQSGPLVALALHSDAGLGKNGFLASVGSQGVVKLWYSENLRFYRALEGQRAPLRSAAFSPDGERLVFAGAEPTVWDWAARGGSKPLKGDAGKATFAALFLDGERIVTGGRDLRIWDAAAGRLVKTLGSPEGGAQCLAFSPVAGWLAAGAGDGTLALWDVDAGRQLELLEGHTDRVTCIAFSPDGLRIASGSADGTAKLWTVGPPDPLELAELDAPWRKQLQAAMQKEFTLDFLEMPVQDVLAYLGKLVKVTMILHPALARERLAVTLKVDRASVRTTLTQVCQKAGAALRVYDGAILVTREDLEKGEPFPPAEFRWPVRPAAAYTKMWAAMLKEISFDFVEVPLWDAVAFVSTLTDCTIVLDSEVVRDAPRSITLRVDRMRTGRALRWICRLAGVAYGCRDEAIFITTPERAKAMPPRYGAARRRDGRLREGQEPPDDQAAAAMAKKISFDFVETPLQDVVAFISSLADITIVLDPDALRDEPRSLTLRVVDMRLADALRWVVKLVGMSYAWHDGALFVSMPGVLRELTSQEEALRVLQRPPTRALSATMAKPISFDLAETPLPDALRTLGERTGLHIALDPKADEATLRPLTLRVTEGQFDGALGWACTLTDTTYLWRDVDLVVTKPDLVDTRFRREEALRRLSRPPTKELAERMAEPVSFDFVETPLLDVIAFLVKLSGMNVVLDPGRIQGEAPAVTLRVHDMPLSAALRWVCRLAGRVCSWQDEALFVATLERAEAVRRQAEEFRPLQQPPSEELAARMAQEVNFNVTKAAMEDLLATTAESTDVPIILDPQAAEGGEPSITLSLRSARLDSALRWVCRRAGLVYVWRDGKIVVTTPERARVAPEPKE